MSSLSLFSDGWIGEGPEYRSLTLLSAGWIYTESVTPDAVTPAFIPKRRRIRFPGVILPGNIRPPSVPADLRPVGLHASVETGLTLSRDDLYARLAAAVAEQLELDAFDN